MGTSSSVHCGGDYKETDTSHIVINVAFRMKRLEKNGENGKNRQKLYKLIDMHGGGELIPWMKYARNTGDHAIIDEYLDTKVDLNYIYFLL
jgi:hypothetical protein